MKHIRTEYLTTTRLFKLKRTLKKKEDKLREEILKKFTPIKTLSALKQFANVYTIGRDDDHTIFAGYDPITFFNTAKTTLVPLLKGNKGI